MSGKRIFVTSDAEFWDSPQWFGLSEQKNREHGNAGCQAVLDLFDRLRVNATFFVPVELRTASGDGVSDHPERPRRCQPFLLACSIAQADAERTGF